MSALTRGALAVLAAGLGVAGCGGSGSAATPAGQGGDARRATAREAAAAFLDANVTAEGRVRRPDQGDDTVSEGQAYALLTAAGIGDEERFDRIWTWTTANLRRDDGLLAFRWADGEVADPQAATDADLDAARALLVGSCRFERPELRREALALGRRVLDLETTTSGGGARLLVAGPWARGEEAVVNPSYLDPTSLTALGRASGDARYAAALTGTRAVVARVSAPLPPDWAVVDGSGAARAVARPDGSAGAGRSTFDAPRTLLRLAASPDAADRRQAARAWPALREGDPAVVERELDGRPAGASRHPVALVGAAAAAGAAGDAGAERRLLDMAAALQRDSPTYYGGALVALGRLMLQTDRLDPSCAGR